MQLGHGSGFDPYIKPTTIFAKTHDGAENDLTQGGLADAITAIVRSSKNAMNNPMSTIASGVFAHENHVDPVLVANALDWLRMRYKTHADLAHEANRMMAERNV